MVLKQKKDKLRIICITDRFRIEGDMHLVPQSRLSDYLNAESGKKQFLPLTGVKIYDLEKDELKYNTQYLNLNKNNIVVLFVDEISSDAAMVFVGEAQKEIMKGNYQAGIRLCQKALKINDDVPEAYYTLGMAYGKTGEINKAHEMFEKVLSKTGSKTDLAKKTREMMSDLKK